MNDVIVPPPKKTLKQKFFPKSPWWKNLVFDDWRDGIIFLMAIILMLSHYYDTQPYRDVAADPCKYCPACRDDPIVLTEGYVWPSLVNGTTTPPNDYDAIK